MSTYSKFALFRGKYEDQFLSCLIALHEPGFPSVVEALVDFRSVLSEHWRETTALGSCCKETQLLIEDPSYCAKCGKHLPHFTEHEGEEVAGLFLELCDSTLDGISQKDLHGKFEAKGWILGDTPFDIDVAVMNVDRWMDWEDGEPYSGPAIWECRDGTIGRHPLK